MARMGPAPSAPHTLMFMGSAVVATLYAAQLPSVGMLFSVHSVTPTTLHAGPTPPICMLMGVFPPEPPPPPVEASPGDSQNRLAVSNIIAIARRKTAEKAYEDV